MERVAGKSTANVQHKKVSDVQRTSHDQAMQPGYNAGFAAGMSERLQSDGRTTRITSTPYGAVELILDQYYIDRIISILETAKGEIRICAYAWRWYSAEPELAMQKFNVALLRAQKRGVRVRALVDTLSMKSALEQYGIAARYVSRKRMLHTKAICSGVDVLILGSHNLTKRATSYNYEASLLTTDFEVCMQFVTYFDSIWAAANES